LDDDLVVQAGGKDCVETGVDQRQSAASTGLQYGTFDLVQRGLPVLHTVEQGFADVLDQLSREQFERTLGVHATESETTAGIFTC
jgi:hypothetical protein